MVEKKNNGDAATSADAEDIVVDPMTGDDDGADLADDFVDVSPSEDKLPEELRDDEQDPSTLPATGLVSEFHDLTSAQAAYLVSHREASSVLRSPVFYVSALLLGLAVIASLVVGFQRAGAGIGEAPDTLAVVGVEQEQADAFSQQIGLPVVSVEDQETGEAMLRNGEAGAVYVLDPTGMQQASLLALDREPKGVLDTLNQPIPVEYLDPPTVDPAISDPVAWGMSVVVLLAGLTLGSALYQNLRTEKRNRLAEVIAATIPAGSAAWGRVYGLTLLSLTFPLTGGGVLLVGLSIGQRTDLAVALLPALGWFALIAVATALIVLSAHLWVGTRASTRSRRIGYGTVVVLTVTGALAPLVLQAQATVMLWLSYAPLTAPVAMPMRYMAGQADWWEGLASAGVSAVVGAVVFWLAAAAYRRTLLQGAGRAGRTAAPSKRRAARTAA